MNALRTILLLLAMLPAFAMGQPFTIPQYDLSIDLPTGWIHDEEDQFGFVLYDPKSPGKKRKIRVLLPVTIIAGDFFMIISGDEG